MSDHSSTETPRLSGNALIGVFLFFAAVLYFFSDTLTFVVGLVLIGAAFAAYYDGEHKH